MRARFEKCNGYYPGARLSSKTIRLFVGCILHNGVFGITTDLVGFDETASRIAVCRKNGAIF